jgi:hypothetical protein
MSNQQKSNIEKHAIFSTGDDSGFVDKMRKNVKSDLIIITEDKLENILLKHLQSMGIRTSWIIPLSILVTVLLAELTANFGDKFGIKASNWESLFQMITLISAGWFVISIIRLIKHWNKGTLSYLIKLIKNVKEEQDSEQSDSLGR